MRMVNSEQGTLKNRIPLDWIDTEVAAQNFANQIDNDEDCKTYFLNGSWGSGKTEFLHQVVKKSKKKFIFLNLWQIKDERTVIALGFHRLFPVLSWVFRAIFVISVVVAILMTNRC